MEPLIDDAAETSVEAMSKNLLPVVALRGRAGDECLAGRGVEEASKAPADGSGTRTNGIRIEPALETASQPPQPSRCHHRGARERQVGQPFDQVRGDWAPSGRIGQGRAETVEVV